MATFLFGVVAVWMVIFVLTLWAGTVLWGTTILGSRRYWLGSLGVSMLIGPALGYVVVGLAIAGI